MQTLRPDASPVRPSHRRLKILLTEGSSLSARQTLYALGRLGHVLDVCDPGPLTCLCRYSRYVRACYACPSFATYPADYVVFLQERLKAERYDVLFPTHDQAFLLARVEGKFRGKLGLAVPDFAAMLRVQSKAALVALLDELKLPHPPTTLVHSRTELERAAAFPCYIKLPYATAGCGVWHIARSEELRQITADLEKTGLLNGQGEVLVQQPAAGTLCVVQSVFCHGRLVAAHCYQARAQGVGGSARARVGVAHPLVLEHVAKLGGCLGWHGALMLDYLFDETAGRPAYIDANPRIGETMNATLSGLNLCDLLVQVSLGQSPPAPPAPWPGVQTHAITMSLLAKAEAGARRRQLLGELAQAWSRKGVYAASEDELTRPHEDGLSVLPAAFVALRLLAQPRAAKQMVASTVSNYALSQHAVERILQL
jgi:hypothetical protein